MRMLINSYVEIIEDLLASDQHGLDDIGLRGFVGPEVFPLVLEVIKFSAIGLFLLLLLGFGLSRTLVPREALEVGLDGFLPDLICGGVEALQHCLVEAIVY